MANSPFALALDSTAQLWTIEPYRRGLCRRVTSNGLVRRLRRVNELPCRDRFAACTSMV